MKKNLFLLWLVLISLPLIGCECSTDIPPPIKMRTIAFVYNGDRYKDSSFHINGAYPSFFFRTNTDFGTLDSISGDRKYLVIRALDQYEPLIPWDEDDPTHQNPARVFDLYLSSTQAIQDTQMFIQDSSGSNAKAFLALDIPFPSYDPEGHLCYRSKQLTVRFTKVSENETHGTFSGVFENRFGSTLYIKNGVINILK